MQVIPYQPETLTVNMETAPVDFDMFLRPMRGE
jgi:hypothetical protein